MKKVITNLLFELDFIKEIDEYINYLNQNKCYENFMQGPLWKEKVKKVQCEETDKILPIFIYFDEFETNNPLGCRKGLQKLGGVYVSFPFLPPNLKSKLEFIYPILLFNSIDLAHFGSKVIFSKLINDLKELEEDGILAVGNNDCEYKIKFVVGLILGDNLAQNAILGFVESFSAIVYCRICLTTKYEAQCLVTENESTLRMKEHYERDSNFLEVKKYGIKSLCVFNELTTFHPYDNYAPDWMHDILEGIGPYELALILDRFINTHKIFSIDILNERIRQFDFGNRDNINKPQPISLASIKNHSLSTSASEALYLIKYFGMLVGDFEVDNFEEWDLFIMLKQIVEILLLENVNDELIELFKTLIKNHHLLFIKIFGLNLRPKHHFLLHYGNAMKKVGPLKQVWTMRFESLHHRLKQIASNTKTRRNIPFTILTKYQLTLLSKGNLENIFSPKTGPTCELDFEVQSFIEQSELSVNDLLEMKFVKWAIMNDQKLKLGNVLDINYNTQNEFPLFGEIKAIGKSYEKNLLIFNVMKTDYYDSNHCAYVVNKTNEYKIMENNIFHCNIFDIFQFNNILYIV